MTPEYIAGFFDGEGTITLKNKKTRIWLMCISQTDYHVLELIRDFYGVGYIYKITTKNERWKQAWLFSISKQEDILLFLQSVVDHLVVKRDTVLLAIPEIESFVRSELNKKRKRDKNIKIVKQMRQDGLSYRDIARQTGLNRTTTNRWMRKMDL